MTERLEPLQKMIQLRTLCLLTPPVKEVTIERLERSGFNVFSSAPTSNRMNKVVSPFTAFLQDAEPASDPKLFNTAVNPVTLDDLIHELRQPLGVIESLTYFIELTTTDETIVPRLEHIQSMLVKVHHMLEDASERGMSEWPAHLPSACS